MTTITVNLDVMLSVIHNRLVADFDTYREFLNWMTRAQLPLWEVNRARITVRKQLIKDHPELLNFPPPDKTDSGNAKKYVRSVSKKVGYETCDVVPLRTAMKVRTLSAVLS